MASSAEALNTLFEPDVVLPSQLGHARFEGLRGGERKLMAALLSDGIEAYINYYFSKVEASDEAKAAALAWVEVKDPAYVFSFDSVCECLGINPDYLRRGLRRYCRVVEADIAAGRGRRNVWKKIRRPRK